MLAKYRRVRSRSLAFTPVLILLIQFAALLFVWEAPAGSQVFKSTDRGRSWSRSDQGLPGNTRINAFCSVADLLLAGTDSGVFVSTNQGQNWRQVADVPANCGRILSFGATGQKLYAGTDRLGIIESTDPGVGWSVNKSFPAKHVRSLLTFHEELYAGTDAEGLYVSNDNGGTWQPLAAGLPDHAQVFGLAGLRGTVFAGLYSKGLYRWEQQRQRWSRSGSVVPLVLASIEDTLVVGHNPGGLYASDDLGASWSKAAPSSFVNFDSLGADQTDELASDAPVWELGSGCGLVLAGAASGIYYSEDKGHAWTRARRGLPEESPGVAFLVRREFILAATVSREMVQSARKH